MQLAAALLGLAGLGCLALLASTFIPMATGGTAFDAVWPYLGAVIVGSVAGAAGISWDARKNPEAWRYRSVWPRRIAAVLLVAIAVVFVLGTIA